MRLGASIPQSTWSMQLSSALLTGNFPAKIVLMLSYECMGVIWWGTGGGMSPPLFYPRGTNYVLSPPLFDSDLIIFC